MMFIEIMTICYKNHMKHILRTPYGQNVESPKIKVGCICKVWQHNSQNGPVKEKIVYLCTSGCCCLWNTLLVKLCSSWDDGATARNSHENRLPEYLPVTSCCVECQECQQIFIPSGHFVILERAKNHRGQIRWTRWMAHFCNGFISQEFVNS
jgi:hypothetical protein